MPAIAITLDVKDDSNLADLEKSLTFAEKLQFADHLAGDIEEQTRSHIQQASQSRHKTARKLQATETNYLLNKAASVEAIGSPGRILLSVSGDIFKRTFQPVTVNATAGKMLTIPWTAEAYGKRAREFGDNLFVYRSQGGNGPAFLARRQGVRMQFLFLLKRSVVLPQDRGLLPSEEDFLKTAEQSADDFTELEIRKLEAKNTSL
jgi:hypothetical protein